MNEEYGCIAQFESKMKPQLCFFLKKPSLVFLLVLLNLYLFTSRRYCTGETICGIVELYTLDKYEYLRKIMLYWHHHFYIGSIRVFIYARMFLWQWFYYLMVKIISQRHNYHDKKSKLY